MPALSEGVTAHLELGRIADKKNDFSLKGGEMRFVAAILVGLVVRPAGVSAHHSTAEYDTSAFVELTGELVGVRWRNPHVMFTVCVDGSDGAAQDWELATGAVYVVERTGLDKSEFPVGAIAYSEGRRREGGLWPATEPDARMYHLADTVHSLVLSVPERDGDRRPCHLIQE